MVEIEVNLNNNLKVLVEKHRYGYLHSKVLSPNRDPVTMRTQYEELLQETIEMYSGQESLTPVSDPDFVPVRPPLPTAAANTLKREHRGSSAGNNSK